ncbi:MAG: AraC family transcriptional regulator [Myxococcota bacterium]
MRSPDGHVSVVLVRALLSAAADLGWAEDELLRSIRLDPALIADPDAAVPKRVEQRIWRALVERFGSGFGLKGAATLGRGSFRALEYAVRAAGTFGEGLERLVRFGCLLHGQPLFKLERHAAGASILYLPQHQPPEVAAAAGDFAIGALTVVGRDATGTAWVPKRVLIGHPAPEDRTPYDALFKAPVVFSAGVYQLELDERVVRLRMPEADPVLASILARFLGDRTSERGNPAPGVVERVRDAIADGLPDREPDLASVASALGYSPRTLQKHLRTGGTRFRDVADEVRLELARRYLEQDGTTLAGVALLVGYSELSAFVRAFKRWTGMTPGEYRRRRRGLPEA